MAYGWFMDGYGSGFKLGLPTKEVSAASLSEPHLAALARRLRASGGPGNSRCNPSLVGLPSGNGWHSHESHGPVSSLIYHDLPIFQAVIFNSYVSLPEGILFGIPFQCYGMVWECPLTMNMICSCKTTGQNRPEVICGHFKILGMACAVSPSLDIARWFLNNSNILRFCPTPGPVPPAMPPTSPMAIPGPRPQAAKNFAPTLWELGQ